MWTHIVDNKLVKATGPKSFCFDLPKHVDKFFNYEIYSIRKDEILNEQKIKKKVSQLLTKCKLGNNLYEYREQ